GAWSPDGSVFAYSANARTPTDSEIWVQQADGGEPRSVFGEGKFALAAGFSPDGSKLLAVDFRANDDQSLFLVDPAGGAARELTPHEGPVKYFPGPWAADGSGFHLLTDEGREFVGIAFYDLGSGERRWVETPEREIEALAGSADGRVLAWLENDDGRALLRLSDVTAGAALPEPQLPPGTVSPL